jgi:hypothetical protein
MPTGKCLSHPHREESTSSGSPCIKGVDPERSRRVQRGTYSSPNPSKVKKLSRSEDRAD